MLAFSSSLFSFFLLCNLGSFSYTSHAGFIFIWGVSLTHPVLASFSSGEFLLSILYWVHFYLGSFSHTSCAGFYCYLGSFSYTSCVGFIFVWAVSLTHPMLALFFCGEFLLHIPRSLHFYLGSFSYTSHAGFTFIWGVSLTHPVLAPRLF